MSINIGLSLFVEPIYCNLEEQDGYLAVHALPICNIGI